MITIEGLTQRYTKTTVVADFDLVNYSASVPGIGRAGLAT